MDSWLGLQVGFYCWSNLDTNVKDWYEYKGLIQMSKSYNLGYKYWGWIYELDTLEYPTLIHKMAILESHGK